MFAGPRTSLMALETLDLDERIGVIEPILADLTEQVEELDPAPIPPRPPRRGLTRLRLGLAAFRKSAAQAENGLECSVEAQHGGLAIFDPAVLAARLLAPPQDWWQTASSVHRASSGRELLMVDGLADGTHPVQFGPVDGGVSGEVDNRSGLLFIGGLDALEGQVTPNMNDPELHFSTLATQLINMLKINGVELHE